MALPNSYLGRPVLKEIGLSSTLAVLVLCVIKLVVYFWCRFAKSLVLFWEIKLCAHLVYNHILLLTRLG